MKTSIIKVSLTIFIASLFLIWIIKEVEDLRINRKVYKIEVVFNSVAGIQKKAEVRLGGLKMGEVIDVALNKKNNKISVFLKLDKEIKIKKNSIFLITSESFLGIEKYVEIIPQQGVAKYIKEGDTLYGEDPIEARDVIRRMNKTFENLQTLTNVVENLVKEKNLGEILNDIVVNIKSLTENTDKLMVNINKIAEENRADLKDLIENLRVISANFKDTSYKLKELIGDKKVNEDIKKTIENIRKSTERIDKMTETLQKEVINKENLEGVGETLKTVSKNVDKIKGLNFSPNLQFGHKDRSGHYQTNINLDIYSKDIYYNLGLEDVSDSKKLNLQVGKKFPRGVYLRGGIKKGDEGVGVDYKDNNILLRGDVINFDSPQLNLQAGIKVMPSLYFLWCLEDATKSTKENLFGIEIRK